MKHPEIDGRPVLIGDRVVLRPHNNVVRQVIDYLGGPATVIGIEYARITGEAVIVIDGLTAGIVLVVSDIERFAE